MGNQSQYSLDGRGGDNEGQRSRSTTATRSEIESEYYRDSRGRSRGRGYSNRTARDRTSVFQPSRPTFLRDSSRSVGVGVGVGLGAQKHKSSADPRYVEEEFSSQIRNDGYLY